MIPTPPTEPQEQTKETDKEMIVQGVVIPSKPVPPKDDGMSTYLSLFSLNEMMEADDQNAV